jgi:hypothetical protein
VRDTIARQSDVDANSIKYEVEPGKGRYLHGTIAFAATKGKSIDLEKLQKSLKGTRLGKGTRSGVNYLEITAEGEVAVNNKDILLKVSGTTQEFKLVDDPKAKPKEGTSTPYQRLRAALDKGAKIANVSGRVQAWNGVWPKVLQELEKENEANAPMPRLLIVTEFETVSK